MSLRIFKSAHFDFYDGSHEVAFVYGTGKSNHKRILAYTESSYDIAKRDFQEFLKEKDLRLKIVKLANALNMPLREPDTTQQLVFFFEVAWHFDMEKKAKP
jgi:hypothetical protein